MGRGPYESPVEKFTDAVQKGSIKKNFDYTLNQAAKEIGISRNWLDSCVSNENYRREVELRLKVVKGDGVTLRAVTVRQEDAKGIRVEGCEYGPLQTVRWPLLPRFQEWHTRRPTPFRDVIRHFMNRPGI